MKQHGLGLLILNAVFGLFLGAICLAAGLTIVGMGHGWELPFRYGWLSLLLYPLAMVRWRWIGRGMAWRRDAGAMAAVGLPILAMLIVVGGPGYFIRSLLAGWPIIVGGLVTYWFASRILARSDRAAMSGDGVLLAAGIALDLAALTDFAGSAMAHRAGILLFPWTIAWLGWQAIATAALLGRRPAATASPGPSAP